MPINKPKSKLKSKIKCIRLIDDEKNYWWLLLSGNYVLAVFCSALPYPFRIMKSKLRVCKPKGALLHGSQKKEI